MPFDTAPRAPSPMPPVSAPPVGVGSILARTFSTWWSRIWAFAGTTLVLLVPVYVFQFAVVMPRVREDPLGARWVSIAFAVLAALAMMVVACGHTYGAVMHLAGKPVRVGAMLSAAVGRFLPVLALLAVGIVAYLVFALVVGVLATVLIIALGRMLGLVLTVLVVVPLAVILGTALSLTIPAMVAERTGPIRAIGRSWQLTRGRRGALFLALFLVALIIVGIALLQLAVMAAVTGAAMFSPEAAALAYGSAAVIGVGLVAGLVQVLLAPLVTLVSAVAYHDLRIEKEGIATDDLAKVFE